MFWDIKNIDPLFYFTKKDGFFGVLNKVFISEFEQSFLTRNVLSDFGSYRSPNWACDSFLKIPRCLVCFPKFQLIIRCGLEAIGFEVKSVQKEYDFEQ